MDCPSIRGSTSPDTVNDLRSAMVLSFTALLMAGRT
jgi:hypothetical protein